MEIPLEMKGMIYACRPNTPYVGLHRQSRDPKRTKFYYEEAKRMRNEVCFHSMLRETTCKFTGYRALRRLWINALYQLLNIRYYKNYIIAYILEYIQFDQTERISPFYSKNYWILDYTILSPKIRMEQIAGKLASLGYTNMVLPIPDYEYEGYLTLAENYVFIQEIDIISYLYHQLKKKNIKDKWPIMSSYIYFINLQLSVKKKEWITYCERNVLSLYLNACIRVNTLNQEEIILLTNWVDRLKYPSR